MQNKHKHLEFIQGVINRMAGNLFFLRGWTITLIVALFAFLAKDSNLDYIFIIYFPVVIFWILDGYFLSQERLFRSLYNYVRKLDEKQIDFSMNTSKYKEEGRNGWMRSIFSDTLLFFYLPLVVVITLIIFLINYS